MQSGLNTTIQPITGATSIVDTDSHGSDRQPSAPPQAKPTLSLAARQPTTSKPESLLLSSRKANIPASLPAAESPLPLLAINSAQQPTSPLSSPDSTSSDTTYFDARTCVLSDPDTDSTGESDDSSDSDYFDAQDDVQHAAQSQLPPSAEHQIVTPDQHPVADEQPGTPIDIEQVVNSVYGRSSRPKAGMLSSGVKWVRTGLKRLWSNITVPTRSLAIKAPPLAIEPPPAVAKPLPAANPSASEKSYGGIKNYLLNRGLDLARDPMIQRALANAIGKVVIAELKQAATPAPDPEMDNPLNATRRMLHEDVQIFAKLCTDDVINQTLSDGVGHVLHQDDTRYIKGFVTTISPPVRRLAGEFYRQQLDWAYHTEEGRRFLEEALTQFIGERVESVARTLTGDEPETSEDTLPEFLHQKVASGFQQSAALLQERLTTLANSATSRQFIDDMVMQLVAEGSDKLHDNFDDLQARAFEIIRTNLNQACTTLLNQIKTWGEFERDTGYIRLLREDVIGKIASETTRQYDQIGDMELLKLVPKGLFLKKILRWLSKEALSAVCNPDTLANMVNDFMARTEPQIKQAVQEQVHKIQWLASQHHQHGRNFSTLANRLALNEAIKNRGHIRPTTQPAITRPPCQASNHGDHTTQVMQPVPASSTDFTLPLLRSEELQAIGQGLIGALQVGLQTTHDQRETIEAAITPRLEQLVNLAFATARKHGGRWLTDEQNVELMEATLPWCQGFTKGLLHEGLIEGLQAAGEWLKQDGTLTTLTGLLTAPSNAQPATDLANLVVPRIRRAIDDRLDQTMAQMLREGAHRFQSTINSQQLLALPVISNALDDAIGKAIQSITDKASEELEPLAQEVLQPVQAMLQQELLTVGPASIHFIVAWLKDERHTHDLVAALLPGFEPLIARVLSEIVATQLADRKDSATLQQLTAPWLSGLVQQLLTPAVHYSLKRAIDWADRHQQPLEELIQPQLAQTLDAAQPLMLETIKKRLAQLRSAMAGSGGVAQNALKLADQLAPDHDNTPPQTEADGDVVLAPKELQKISTDLAAAAQLALDEVLLHENAIRKRINTGVSSVIATALESTADYVAHQAAGDDAESLQATQFATAAAPWCQQLATTLLSEALTEGFTSCRDWQLQPLIQDALGSAMAGNAASDTPATLGSQVLARCQPMINAALDQTMATVLHRSARQLQETLDSQQLFKIPAVRAALDSTLRTAICDGVSKTEQHLEQLTQHVLTPVTKEVARELLRGQMATINQVLAWLDNKENAQKLVATVTPGFRTVIKRVLIETLNDKLADAAPLKAVLQPALLRLVDTMLEPTAGHILAWVVDWAKGEKSIIVEQVQQEIEQALAICQPELIKAIQQRADQLLSTMTASVPDSTTARALSLAQQLVPGYRDPSQPVDDTPLTLQTKEADALGKALSASVRLALQTLHDQQETILSTLHPHLERVVAKAVTTGSDYLAQTIASDAPATMEPGRFSHAAAPWCQNLATDLLSQALTKGLTGALSWADDEAHQAITKALTSTGEQTAIGRQTSAHTLLMPHIQQVLDDQLDQGMAGLLRRIASQWHKSINSNQILAQPFVQTLLDQQLRQVLNTTAADAREQLTPLSQQILDPVREQLQEELLSFQATSLDKALSWLKNPEQTREIMATVLPPLTEIFERVLADILAKQLPDRTLTAPMLNGLLRHLLPPAMDYALQRLTHWCEQNRQRVLDEMTPQITQTLDAAQPLLLTAIDQRLKQLQIVSSDEHLAARAESLAEQLVPAVASCDKPSQSQWLKPLLPQVSQTITSLITQGAQRIGCEPALVPTLIPHVQRVIYAAIGSSTDFVNQRLAEPTDGDVTHINLAVASHLQDMVAGYLSQGLASGIEQAVTAIANNQGELNQAIATLLSQQLSGEESASSTNLNSTLTPLIDQAVDQLLDKQALLTGINAWIADHATTVTPQLQQAMDKALSYIIANISEFLLKHKHGVTTEVLPVIHHALIQSLITAQADLISSVARWLSDEANRPKVVAALLPSVQPVMTKAITQALAPQLGGPLPETVAAITPTVGAIVNQTLDRALTGTAAWVADQLPAHQEQITALTEPLISKNVAKAMPAVAKAVQNKALTLAQSKVQDIDFNRLAAELSVAFAEQLDLDSATDGAVKVGPGTSITKELPRLLCLLMQSTETYRSLGGSLSEPVLIDHLTIGGAQFKNIRAQLTQLPDGSVRIQQMDLVFRDDHGVDMDIELTGVSLNAQWPKNSKLYKAALLSGAAMMSPADAAASLFNAFTPDSIDIRIDHISGEFQDALLDGPHDDTVGFGLSDLELDVRLHKYYPSLYTDIRVRPNESIVASVRGQGLVEHIDANIKIDANRAGYVDVEGRADPGRLSRLLRWLVGGKIHVCARIPVHNGIAALDDITSITALTDRRFSGLCNAVLKNTLRANHPQLTSGEDGKEVIKLKLALFAENRANRVTSWLARTANRIFRFFFPRPIEIRAGFQGIPYIPPAQGELGLGSFNFSRFIGGLAPWPVSLQSETHRQLLHDLKTAYGDRAARLRQLDKIIDHVISEFGQGNAPSDLSLVREIPLTDWQLLVDNVALNRNARPRLLFMVACLTEALPEKAVQLINACGPASRPYLLDLVGGTPRTQWLTNPDGTLMEPGYQWQQFKRLRQFWLNSRNNPDGNIYSPESKGGVQQCGEKVAELVKELGDKLDLPDELKLVLARDFDFASKLFKPETDRQDGQPSIKLPEVRPFPIPIPEAGELKDGSAAA